MNSLRILRATGAWLLAIVSGLAQAGAYEDFFKAVTFDDATAVGQLLRRGFDVNSADEKGQPALVLAMRDGAFKVAEVLIAQPQIRIDAANSVGETPLMMAALKGHTEWAQRLMDRGARLERAGWTPLHYAATGPEVRLVAMFLDRGAPIDARSPNGSTPLMMAARYGTEDAVRELLSRGADTRLRNERDMNAADFARSAGRDSLAARLDVSAR